MASKENLTMMKENNFDYLCVSRLTLKNYTEVESS
jgi:hypothetical protein